MALLALLRFRFVVSVFVLLIGILQPDTGAAQTLTAQITYPPDGATDADMSQAMQWTTVPNAQAYYLYVGTVIGDNDLVNSGETQAPYYLAPSLPIAQTVFARLWTKVGGIWRSNDSTFTTATVPVIATLTWPINGATNATMAMPTHWTTVPNAQVYYLYVGSTPGAKDLVNTGEIQQTSYLATGLPSNQTVFARLWTKVGGIWRFSDSSFTTAAATVPVIATLTWPVNGASNVNMLQPMQWTTVLNTQAYYLYVGSTLGAKDLVNTGELQATSYLPGGLPGGQTVFARLWTKVDGMWRSSDSSFTTSLPVVATLTYPPNGGVAIDLTQPARWASIANAQAYYLYIGSTQGATDFLDSGETLSNTFPITRLPADPTLYARLWTKTGGAWGYSDTTFTASRIAPEFANPTDGGVGVDQTQPFSWTSPANADAHELWVGTSAGWNDVFDSGQIFGTSTIVNGLPSSGALYARALSRVDGVWRYTDIAFTVEASTPVALIMVPSNGQPGFDTDHPFEWSAVPLARGYHLTVGTMPGGNDLHDSGEIHVTRRFVRNLPIGSLFGRLQTKINGQWYSGDFTFSVAANTVSAAHQISSALWATDIVRRMAPSNDNRPISWTELARITVPNFNAQCTGFAQTLLQVLAEMNVQLPARYLNVTLNPNSYDAHTLVEMFDPVSQNWMLLDPTFDLTVTRTATGNWAAAEDMSTATRAQQWSGVSYTFLGELGDYYARGYYLDYPLLFVNIYHVGQFPTKGHGGPVLPYMAGVPMPVLTGQDLYAVGCAGDLVTELVIDGVDRLIDCSGVDGLSYVFAAGSIAFTAQTSASTIVFRPTRSVF